MTFGQQSTTDDVLAGVDLSGKRVLVTGVSAGLGVETTRVLLAHGAEVVGTARDLAKARNATAEIVTQVGTSSGLDLVELDLASLKSVRRCADYLIAEGKTFDVVIANAGVMACPQGKTEDGFETHFGTNHLGHFVFVNSIAPLIQSGGRVVVVSSLAHRFSDVDLNDINFEHKPYVEFSAYGSSKTANILFALEFDRRHKSRGVCATSLHPGGIDTELGRHITPEVAAQLSRRGESKQVKKDDLANKGRAVMKTISQGAATSIWCGFVADTDEIGGRYCDDCNVAGIVDDLNVNYGVASYAVDPERAKLLWVKSEELVGETF